MYTTKIPPENGENTKTREPPEFESVHFGPNTGVMHVIRSLERETNIWSVVSNMNGLFSISYMGFHPSH